MYASHTSPRAPLKPAWRRSQYCTQSATGRGPSGVTSDCGGRRSEPRRRPGGGGGRNSAREFVCVFGTPSRAEAARDCARRVRAKRPGVCARHDATRRETGADGEIHQHPTPRRERAPHTRDVSNQNDHTRPPRPPRPLHPTRSPSSQPRARGRRAAARRPRHSRHGRDDEEGRRRRGLVSRRTWKRWIAYAGMASSPTRCAHMNVGSSGFVLVNVSLMVKFSPK